jgi:hypothetical protein
MKSVNNIFATLCAFARNFRILKNILGIVIPVKTSTRGVFKKIPAKQCFIKIKAPKARQNRV